MRVVIAGCGSSLLRRSAGFSPLHVLPTGRIDSPNALGPIARNELFDRKRRANSNAA
jgi:hypothetical protein